MSAHLQNERRDLMQVRAVSVRRGAADFGRLGESLVAHRLDQVVEQARAAALALAAKDGALQRTEDGLAGAPKRRRITREHRIYDVDDDAVKDVVVRKVENHDNALLEAPLRWRVGGKAGMEGAHERKTATG